MGTAGGGSAAQATGVAIVLHALARRGKSVSPDQAHQAVRRWGDELGGVTTSAQPPWDYPEAGVLNWCDRHGLS